jgi:hypothetical protein
LVKLADLFWQGHLRHQVIDVRFSGWLLQVFAG